MPNIPADKRLWIELIGENRVAFNRDLLPVSEWKQHPEMPPECWAVVTGEAYYCGLEGIGHNQENGRYLILLTPCDRPEGACCNSEAEDKDGHVHLMFMEKGIVTVAAR